MEAGAAAATAMVDPTTGTMLMPAGMGPMGPIFIPVGANHMGPMMAAPQAMGLAPMEMDMSGMVQMMPMGAMGRGGRGGRPMRGRGGGGRFGGMAAPPGTKLDPNGLREYYDLDNPRNNRAVLDYGDI